MHEETFYRAGWGRRLNFGVHSSSPPLPQTPSWLQRNSINGKCANRKLSQRRGHPNGTVPSFAPTTKPYRVPPSLMPQPESLLDKPFVALGRQSSHSV
jgi:hypothetical protein